MSKLRLIAAVVTVTTFLLSQWAMPAVMVLIAIAVVRTLWIQIVLGVLAALWLLLLRPWTMFREPQWSRFIEDLRRAIKALLTNWQ